MTFVDGEQHDFWRVDADRLRARPRLTGAARTPPTVSPVVTRVSVIPSHMC